MKRALTALAVAASCAACHGGHVAAQPAATSNDRAAFAWATNIDPRQPSQALQISPVVEAVSVPVRAPSGEKLMTVFQTKSDASCELDVAYPDGTTQHLPPATADTQGLVRWTWIPTAHGLATANVVCSGGQRGQATVRVL